MTQSSSQNAREVLVIMGSVRAGRRCPEIAAWLMESISPDSSFRYEILDLADWPLPMDDEDGIPALGIYRQPHTQAFSAKITAAHAYIFIAPQYNWGYPAVLKNAIDHLYKEWNDKPAVVLTYGGHGGGKCAEQLRQVLEGIHMRPVPTMPGIVLPRAAIADRSQQITASLEASADAVRQAVQELTAALSQ